MKTFVWLNFLASIILFSWSPVLAQTASCEPPAIVLNANAGNIFSEQQEMDLGDAIAERAEKEFRVIDDAEVNGYLQSIGDRLVKHLPPTNIKFRFFVVDLPETNAFTIAGGRIYVTRKLIAFARNEDELAGVIAHELGHGVVRHSAIDTSKLFEKILGVARVGDRQDVFEKYNQMIDKWRTKIVRTSRNHEDNQQLEADRIGMFAMIAAGYDPDIYTAFWSRFTDARKTNAVMNLFGMTKPADKRLREMIASLKTIPAQCREKKSNVSSTDFDKWKTIVINFSGLGGRESLTAVVHRRKLVPLRSDIEHLRFSPNGEFILAQDNSTVSVLRREPFGLLFQIETQNALPATFTPDSKALVVYNKNLRVQKWSIADKNLISVYEAVNRKGFWQSAISPDGNVLACYEYNGDLTLYDAATSEEIFKEKQFYRPSFFEFVSWRFFLDISDENEVRVINMKFSPDSRYFLAGRKFDAGGAGFDPFPSLDIIGYNSFIRSQKETIAVDVSTRKTFDIGENVKKLLLSSFAFAAPDKIVGQFGKDIAKSGIFAFPSGERVEQFELSGQTFSKPERGNFVVVRPVSGAAVGVYDYQTKKYVMAYRKAALDVFDKYFVVELKSGEIGLHELGKNVPVATVNLPPSRLGGLRAATISPDGNWLSVSEKSRGAVWNVQTGERVIHVRGFRGSYFAPDGNIYADFPKHEKTERTIALMSATTGNIAPGNPITEKNVRQHGQYLVALKSLKPEREEPREDNKKAAAPGASDDEENRERAVFGEAQMEVRDAQTGAVLWTRRFDDERPSFGVSQTHNTMTLVWSLRSKAAKAMVKTDPALSAKLAAMEEKLGDYFVQIVEPKTGKIVGQMLLETGEGSFRIEDVQAAGDWLVVADDENRILLYSISQGVLRQRFFGSNAAINPDANLIAVENVPGRLTIFDLTTGRERERLSFTKPIATAEFLADGKRLFVLTTDQTTFIFDSTKFGAQTANSTKR